MDLKTPPEREADAREKPANLVVLPLNYLDGIRGILMFLVLLVHVRLSLVLSVHGAAVPRWFRWATVGIVPAYYALSAFVVLSGYCLMLPVVRSEDGRLRGGFGKYIKRRAYRLLPTYYIALALSLAAIYIVPAQFQVHVGPLYPTRGAIWSHIFLISNLYFPWRYAINGPLWYLAVEWQLYLLFPTLLLPLWRRYGIKTLVGATLLLGFCPVPLGDVALWLNPWYIPLFAIGMTAASIQYSPRPYDRLWRERIAWGRVAGILFGTFGIVWLGHALVRTHELVEVLPGWKQFLLYDLWFGTATAALILYCGQPRFSHADEKRPGILKFLNHPWIVGLGVFSYSHYLVHFPIVMGVRRVLEALHWKPLWTFLGMFGIAIPLSLSLGYLFFLAVGQHFLPSHRRVAAAARAGREALMTPGN